MKTLPGFKCNGNGCSAERTETNHWVIVFTGSNVIGIKGFISYPWSDDLANAEGAQHFCGDTCSLKAYADWLSKIRTAPSAEPSVLHGLGRDKEQPLGRPEVETKGLPV
jgi:hypothetical protein